MNKIKPYIVGAMVGVALTFTALAGAYLIYKKGKPLVQKVITKLSDWKFRNASKAAQELMIADFEGPEDFKKFGDSNAEVEVSKEFSTKGFYSAKVIFKKSKSPNFKIEHYFERDKSLANWAPYGSFLFDVHNAQNSPQRFILQIKDTRGNRYKQDISLEPNSTETIEIETAFLRHHLSIYRIAQINIFEWEPKADNTLYFDNFRLVPQGAKTKKTIFDEEFQVAGPVYAAGDYFSFSSERWQKGDYKEFPIFVMNPTSVHFRDFPARGGIPFPKGELKSKSRINIVTSDGRVVKHESKVLAFWPDQSIKWLLINMPATAQAGASGHYFVRYSDKLQPPQETRGMVLNTPEMVAVDTGRVKFLVSKKRFRLFDNVWIGGKEVVSVDSDLTVKFRGVVYRASLDRDYQLTIEENGPNAAVLRAEGWFVAPNKSKFCRFIVRIKAYRDESFVRIEYTFIYTGYPENKYHYLYKGKRLPKNETVEEIAISLRVPEIIKGSVLTFAADGKVMQKKGADTDMMLLQTKDDAFSVVEGGKNKIASGEKLEGWIDLSNEEVGVCAVVRKLWQQYPKALNVDLKDQALVVKLWPKEAGDLDLKTTSKAEGPEAVARGSAFGLGKTHEITYYFHEGDYKSAGSRENALLAQEPPLILAAPAWLSDTRALGALLDESTGRIHFSQYEQAIERLFDWADRQKKTFKWYGMIDFGDTLSWYRDRDSDNEYGELGWHPVGRHGWFNCEGAGSHMGALLQFARTGKYKYLQFGEDMARHFMDIDTCHFNTVKADKRLRGIYEDYSQPGSMHRHNGDHWGGRNEEASHTNLNGILLYHYLTGNERALEVAREIGEFFLKEPITYFRHPDIAPHRGIANILWGATALYEATGDERYKKSADFWANLFFQGQNRNGSFNENYNPRDKRWEGDPHIGYMNGYTLPALIEYHKMTANPAIAAAIIKLVDYLAKSDTYGAIYGGLAYAYYLTVDKKYLETMEKRLNSMLGSQRKQDDPLWNGMIYQKLYYARVVEFLQFTPYAFGAMKEGQKTVKD